MGGKTHCEMFIGMQEFESGNPKKPGYGVMVYADTVRINADDTEFVLEPMVDLECGKSYIFWATVLFGSFKASLIDGEKLGNIERKVSCKLSSSNLNFYRHQYRVRDDFMTAYSVQYGFQS